MRGGAHSWELKFRAEVVDEETRVMGKSNMCKSKKGAIDHAIKDLVHNLKLSDHTGGDKGDNEVAGTTAEG